MSYSHTGPGVFFGAGTRNLVAKEIANRQAKRVLLVTGKESFENCGARDAFCDLDSHVQVARFHDFTQNPKLEDIAVGVDRFREFCPQLVVAIGGGSAMDMGKLLCALAPQDSELSDFIRGDRPLAVAPCPLIAMPTTAGTGSEATHFAVAYIDGRKYSLAHPQLLPSTAIIDPELTYGMPQVVTAATGLDALCQAVEAYWSVQSTRSSRQHSDEAIQLILHHLPACVHAPSIESRTAMSRAAWLSGQAINIAKTTACHALSYAMTSRYGVAHGHAAALTLGDMWHFNSQVSDEDVGDPRGMPHVRSVMERLSELLGCRDSTECRETIKAFVGSLGLATQLPKLGITTGEDRAWIAGQVNAERLANNPRIMRSADLVTVLERAA